MGEGIIQQAGKQSTDYCTEKSGFKTEMSQIGGRVQIGVKKMDIFVIKAISAITST